jgi:hypothetical protein
VDAAGRMELIRELCSFEERGPGTDAERRAAKMLAGRLRAKGRRAEIEPTYVHPQYPAIHLVHAAIAIAGSVVAIAEPVIGFALVLFAATSTYLDLNTRFYLVRSLFFRRASQNVVSPGPRPEARARLILVAHYDAALTGYVFSRAAKRIRRLPERLRLLLGPFRLFFWAGIAPLLPILGARMAGVDANWLSVLQVVPTIVLIVAAFLLIDIALSGIVPGAYDNASGVAAVISAAEELDADSPANLDVWVVLACAEEALCEGMRSFLRTHRDELDRERTHLINVDSVSHGQVTYEVSEGAVVSLPLDSGLIELSEALGSDPRFDARPLRFPLLDDALPARVRKLRAITIRTTEDGALAPWYHTHADVPERVDSGALTRATEFVVGLARLLDREVGRRSGSASGATPAEAADRPVV